MNDNVTQTSMFGTEKIYKILLRLVPPVMFAQLIQALYNIVDSMYVARVSEDALTAVSLAYPLQNLILAVSVGFGIGLNACVARSLGAKNVEETEATAASVFSLMYRFHVSTLDLLSIQLLVHSSMAMAIRAHTPSMIS